MDEQLDPTVGSPRGERNLVVCCDGTNNTLTGGFEDTNVLRLYGYLRKHVDPDTSTLYYDPGVGSPDSAPPTGLVDLVKRRWQRVAGLASGGGVYENIGEAYAFLMREWVPGARILCFGFSRGAFTARAVVGMVNLFGVLRPQHEAMIPTLVRIYFSQPAFSEQVHGRKNWRRAAATWLHVGLARPGKAQGDAVHGSEEVASKVTRKDLALQVKNNFAREAQIYWVGVWDTVESVGLPILGSLDNPSTATFHDKPNIRNVRHALALDEHRWPFLPRLYDSPSEVTTPDGRTLKQLWFPGVHCDIGGSYPGAQSDSAAYPNQRTGLCDASLQWMVNEVAKELEIPELESLSDPGRPDSDEFGTPSRYVFPGQLPLRHDPLHDTPLWALAGMTVRRMQDEKILTNAQAKAGAKDGIAVDVKAPEPKYLAGPSVWDERRKLWPFVMAVVFAVLFSMLSGWNLGPPDGRVTLGNAAGCSFAMQQLATISPWTIDVTAIRPDCKPAPPGGLRNPEVWTEYAKFSPGWAMFLDLLFVACAGYVIARLASRVFTWAAGWRRPGQSRPAWLLTMGWLPALAVGGDVLEDLATLLFMALQAVSLPSFAQATLYLVGISSLAKVTGYLLCLSVFGGGRMLLAVWPTKAVGKVGRKPDELLVVSHDPAASGEVSRGARGPTSERDTLALVQ
ncbi:DUF2235 domain-containing protein [Variovorax sp. YR216]|uniref:T6SS phospholipase effector Tle1-like catalytic domain-containing protein n=1 Tax=Variovorax sp. YR216 TaxID=1882828 RepID=UPI000895EFB4|nr:DUF2235 domain-containing protein [Variovorax sp. YR216]SEB24497.1 Uncharacterized alpha/beta hydrolase domain [Variovorax sp. YR216]